MATKIQKGAVHALVLAHRKKLGMSQSEFGLAHGTNAATVQRWDAGTAKPSGVMVVRLIISGMDPHELVRAFEQDATATELPEPEPEALAEAA